MESRPWPCTHSQAILLVLSRPTLRQAGTPRSNKSTPGELPGPPRGTSRKMSKSYANVLPGMPPGSRGQLFHIFSMKNEARPSAAPPQGGGGFAAAPLCLCGTPIFIKKFPQSCFKDVAGPRRQLFDIFSTSVRGLWRASPRSDPEDFRRTFIQSGNFLL